MTSEHQDIENVGGGYPFSCPAIFYNLSVLKFLNFEDQYSMNFVETEFLVSSISFEKFVYLMFEFHV